VAVVDDKLAAVCRTSLPEHHVDRRIKLEFLASRSNNLAYVSFARVVHFNKQPREYDAHREQVK